MKMFQLRLTLIALGLVTLGDVGSCFAGTKITVGRRFAASQRVSMDAVDHSVWNALLKKYVDVSGNVDYTGWKQSSSDTRSLAAYLDTLSRADANARASRSAKLAFWINAYNAVTIKGILREYPTTSIRNHTAKLYGYNIWHDLLLQVGEQTYSLDTIEHKILRPMGEPRIHFAIVCASKSCPRLLNAAYTANNLEEQLATNTRQFFASSANFRNDASARRFYLSSILKWFSDDFGSDQAAQLRAIAPYLPTASAQKAARTNSIRVSYLNYDWGLNDQATARSARR